MFCPHLLTYVSTRVSCCSLHFTDHNSAHLSSFLNVCLIPNSTHCLTHIALSPVLTSLRYTFTYEYIRSSIHQTRQLYQITCCSLCGRKHFMSPRMYLSTSTKQANVWTSVIVVSTPKVKLKERVQQETNAKVFIVTVWLREAGHRTWSVSSMNGVKRMPEGNNLKRDFRCSMLMLHHQRWN